MIKIKFEYIFYPTTEYKQTNKMSNQQQTEEKKCREEDKEQYKKICDAGGCYKILDIDTPIMCYMNKQNGDKTLCRVCYEDGDYQEDDENSDNDDSDDEEEEEDAWCEVGEHHVSKDEMWKDFADCKNCVSEKEYKEQMEEDEKECASCNNILTWEDGEYSGEGHRCSGCYFKEEGEN